MTRPSRAIPLEGLSFRRLAARLSLLSCVLLAATAPRAIAQTTIRSVPITLANLIQAADANYYGIFQGTNLCTTEVPAQCPQIFRIVPSGGVPTSIYTFTPNGTSNPPGGTVPLSLLQAPDGYLYGTTLNGGDLTDCTAQSAQIGNSLRTGCGYFFKVAPDGSAFTIVHSFSTSEVDAPVNGSSNAISGGTLILGSDGAFYGTSGAPPASTLLGAELFDGQFIYRLTAHGSFTQLYNFDPPTGVDSTIGAATSGLVEATDGNFYGTTPGYITGGGKGPCGSYNPVASATTCGNIFRLTFAGQLHVTASFPSDVSLGANPISGPLVEGPTGDLYGMTTGFSDLLPPAGTIFRTTTNGGLTTLHTFTPPSGGFYPSQPLLVGTDGTLYGTATTGGVTSACPPLMGCGNIFSIQPDGSSFTDLYDFPGGAYGAFPGAMIADSTGAIVGVTGSDSAAGSPPGTIFTTTINPAVPPIQLTVTDQKGNIVRNATPGQALTLNWAVFNAFSNTMQQCWGFTSNTAEKNWQGKQTSTAADPFGSSLAITAPAVAGTYIYVLTCAGIESGRVSFAVGSAVTIPTTTLPVGTVGVGYSGPFSALGGIQPYAFTLYGAPPPGLSFDPGNANLGGTPKQYGVYQVSVGVQDSSVPPQTYGVTIPLTINSGLLIANSLPNAVMDTAYSQAATATGGLPPYKWTLASGQLPAGLSLNATTGVVHGTPTAVGKSTFAITVTDSESKAARATQTYTISTAVPALTVESGPFPDCTVNQLCEGQEVATGGTPPYTWAVVPGSVIPPGLTYTTGGSFSGKPIQYGLFDYQVQVTDSEVPPVTATGSSSINVLSGLAGVAVNPLPNAMVGVPYFAAAPVVTGGIPPYKWEVTTYSRAFIEEFGSNNGTIYGTPIETGGPYDLHYHISDSEANPATIILDTSLSVVLAPLATTTTLTTSAATAGTGMNVTFTAHVSNGGSAPTGVIAFFNGTASLATATLDKNGNASVTTSFAANGVYSITATYSGDAANGASVSSALTETVVTPTVTATANPGTLTIKSGASGMLVLTLTPVGGYTGTITFSCGALPAHVSCTFAPPSVTLAAGSGPVSSTLTVNTGAAATAMLSTSNINGISIAMMLLVPGSLFGLVGFRKRRREAFAARWLFLFAIAALTLAAASALGGCGGPSTAAQGTYTLPITLTLTDGSMQSVNATVIVD